MCPWDCPWIEDTAPAWPLCYRHQNDTRGLKMHELNLTEMLLNGLAGYLLGEQWPMISQVMSQYSWRACALALAGAGVYWLLKCRTAHERPTLDDAQPVC